MTSVKRSPFMPHKFPWRALLIAIISVALTAPARAESIQTAETQIIAGIVVVSAGIAVLVTVLVLHHRHKKDTITGCVASGAKGMSVTAERDKQTYALAGDPVGAGERMTLEGKWRKADHAFEARSVTKDFGACAP